MPVEAVSHNSLGGNEDMPINCYITNTLLHQRQMAKAASYACTQEQQRPDVEDSKTVSESEENALNVDHTVAQSSSLDSAKSASATCPDENAPVTPPIDAHPVESAAVPKTPSQDDSEEFEDVDSDGPTLITETKPRVGRSKGVPEMIAMKRMALLQKSATPPPEVKATSQVLGNPEETPSMPTKESSTKYQALSLSDSGSELSDNDWLDEDLLPRK
jgi:hypothetical protein